jgi:hypothetical protein
MVAGGIRYRGVPIPAKPNRVPNHPWLPSFRIRPQFPNGEKSLGTGVMLLAYCVDRGDGHHILNTSLHFHTCVHLLLAELYRWL